MQSACPRRLDETAVELTSKKGEQSEPAGQTHFSGGCRGCPPFESETCRYRHRGLRHRAGSSDAGRQLQRHGGEGNAAEADHCSCTRRMGATTVEIPSSHVPMVSHPNEVADLIEKAANAVGVPATTR